NNTWDLTGDWYFRVFTDDNAFDPHLQLSIRAMVLGTCGSPPQTGTAPVLKKTASSSLVSPTATTLAGGKKTLIFTHTGRLIAPNGQPLNAPSNAALLTSFRNTVNNFAAHPAVNGVVVDLASDAGLGNDFAQWDTPPFPSC